MEKVRERKSGPAAIYRLCPKRHILAAFSALVIVLHLLTRDNYAVNAFLSERFVRSVHRALARLTSLVGFSVAELLISAAVLGLLTYIILFIIGLIRRGGRFKRVYRFIVSIISAGLGVYAGFCLLWGVYYYGDDFAAKSGIETGQISLEQLETVTRYFAALANEYSDAVPRDERGVCDFDRSEILLKSKTLYNKTQAEYPCLEGDELAPKGVYLSRLMSYIDFSGFFFPFTGEANVNTDCPASLFPATVAHELAHQRGVAKEQEANFVAVMACFDDGDKDFCYSASLLAYTHLGNALYGADFAAWQEVYGSLGDGVRRDFAANRSYWAQFDTAVQAVSNVVYENFLYSYDQDLGLKSYGACVDLLVNYYYDAAVEYFKS